MAYVSEYILVKRLLKVLTRMIRVGNGSFLFAREKHTYLYEVINIIKKRRKRNG